MTPKAKGSGPSKTAGALDTYRTKRDPERTPEPMGRGPTGRQGSSRFVIQEHHARSLHWDLRLERDGVLVSWALPKGIPESPDQNHLAVHTEDHPLEYASFEGEIPQGEYGGGQMTIWDEGHYDVEKWTDTEVKFVLHGAKARGGFVLFQTKDRNWMIHRHGPSTRTDPMPTSLKPMLATAGALPVDSTPWAFEIKWDGVRAILFVEGGRVRAQSRNDLDVSSAFPELADIGAFLGMTTCVLDGEIVALGEDGRPSFARLQHRMHVTNQREARRQQPQTPSPSSPSTSSISTVAHCSPHRTTSVGRCSKACTWPARPSSPRTRSVTSSVRDILAAAVQNGLEGVVAKRRDSAYRPGRRSPDWVKVKSFRTQEAVIGGWTEGRGERAGSLGALLLGIPADDGLRYIGKVGTGFSERARQALLDDLEPLATRSSPFAAPLPAAEAAKAHFVSPEIVGEVDFAEWTIAGRLRHPTWRGLRPDKAPHEVVVESPG